MSANQSQLLLEGKLALRKVLGSGDGRSYDWTMYNVSLLIQPACRLAPPQ